jgi:NADH-quinone oxidoreductase subunit J
MLLVVVYVGAVMVLFLFVVMMLDVDFAELKKDLHRYLPLGSVVGLIVLAELVMVVGAWTVAPQAVLSTPTPGNLSNTEALGQVLYTQYVYLFQAAGFVLLTAMIGAIVLTLQHKPNVKRQDIAAQNARTRASAIENRQVPSRTGVPVP